MASNIPVIVQGNSFSLAIPLQIYYINGDQMDLQDYTPDPTDEVSVQLKGSRRNYTYTPTIDGNVANIDLSGNELADNYSVVVSIVKANGQRLRSFRTDQFFIVESSDDLTTDDIVAGLEENVIYLNTQCFVAGADGRGIESIVKTATAGLVDTYTITYSDNTTSTFNVTNGAAGEAGATIASVEKTATVGKVDTYTITMTDGSTFNFEVTNGLDGVDLGLANIVNDLTTGGATNVLSAEQGKVLGNGIFVLGEQETITLALEQGGFYGAEVPAKQGNKTPSTEIVHPKRVRSADAIRVNGAFSASVTGSNLSFKFYYYNTSEIGHSSFNSSDAEWHTGTFNGNFDGYVCILVKNSSNTNLLPSAVSAEITLPPQLERRIEDSLESDATDMALSANQGKVLNEILFGASGESLSLEQGTILTADGTKPDSISVHNKRVRTVNFIKTTGTFTINISSGFVFKMFYYTSADTSTFESTDEWTDTNTYTGSYNGYVMFCIKKPDSTTITPSDVSATLTQLGIEQRLEDVEAVIPNPTTFEREYIGEVVRVGNNKFKQTAYKTLPRALSQAMAIYGDYILLFTYATSSATAYLYKLSDGTLLATLTLPNSTYKRPHCNAVSFGVTFNSANSIMPLMYVSQWDNDSQKGCLVYDITLSGGTYSASLVQAILPTNVNTSTRGAGQTDWVVDPIGKHIYSIAYLLNDGAHTAANNKTMITKYKLPAISDGAEIVLGDDDVLDHFDIPVYIYRQDSIFENGRILMLAGVPSSVQANVPCRLVSIDPVAKTRASVVSLDYANKEPEGLGVTDGKLLIGFNGDAVIYHFDFI